MTPNFDAIEFSPSKSAFAFSKSSSKTAICITRPALLCFAMDRMPSFFKTLANAFITASLSSMYSNTL